LYFYMTDNLRFFIDLVMKSVPNSFQFAFNNYQLYLPPIIFALILFLISFFKYFFQSGSRTIRIIIYNRILFSCIIISIGAFIILPGKRWLMGSYIIAPASVFIGNMFADDSRKIFNQVAFSLLFLFAVYAEYVFYRYV
jgi:hypothetical protein